jgi:ubiquinone/menaquinone biosynthesis C-methylase UbiE
MSGYVGAQHAFHDAAFVRGWADRFVPTAARLKLFDLILDQIRQPTIPNSHVVELGIGPGYMARHILDRNAVISYEGLDFSERFFEVAKETIGERMHRVTLTKADLMDQSWPKRLTRTPGAIISTWALHDQVDNRPLLMFMRAVLQRFPSAVCLSTATSLSRTARHGSMSRAALRSIVISNYCAKPALPIQGHWRTSNQILRTQHRHRTMRAS